ncbi:MAG: M1 family aminopeptidase [Ignavibacteria bacterium]|nr:M1 family aminopeptidase [Ignavibacteria bacterium]
MNSFSQETDKYFSFECKNDLRVLKSSDLQITSHDFDILYYDITVNWYNVLKNSNRIYPGKVRIIARVDTLVSTNQFLLNSFLTIDSVLKGNSKLNYTNSNGILTIFLDRFYNKNEIIDLEIYFRRTRTDNLGFYYYEKSSQTLENLAYTMTQPSDARYWFPCYDVPSNKADSSRLRIIVPNGFVATGNGLLEQTNRIGDSTIFIWFEPHPIATYLIAICASKYSLFVQNYTSKFPPYETIPIQNYQWSADSARSVYVMRNINLMMECFETFYGKYPFDKYGHAVVSPFAYGGMEHQTISTIHRNWLSWDGQSGIAHELAHQWWGDLVTCETWKDIWLNEGFATFSEDLYREYSQGKSAYFQSMNSKANYYYSNNPGYPIYNPPQIFNAAISYYKGALVLNMLRFVLGDSLFFKTLINYRNQFLYSTATTEDFKNVVNQTTGEDYSYFFNQWIYQPNHPVYVYNWKLVPKQNKYELNFFIKQTQNHYSVYKMPIELKIQLSYTDTTIKIWNTLREQSFTFEFSDSVKNIVFDPQNYILKQASRDISLDVFENSIPLKFELLQNYPNPFNNQTTIRFSLPQRDFVSLKIFNLVGKEIKTLIAKELEAGFYSISFDASELSSGVYLYSLQTNNFKATKKLVLIK